MICRTYCVEIVGCTDVSIPDTDIFAVVRCRLDGADIEVLAVRCDVHGEVTVCANATVPIGGGFTVDLREHFGGARLLSLPRAAREQVVRTVLSHFEGGA